MGSFFNLTIRIQDRQPVVHALAANYWPEHSSCLENRPCSRSALTGVTLQNTAFSKEHLLEF